MDSNGLQAIDEKFLDTGDLFAMRFAQGLVFLEVTGWQQNTYSPYTGVGEIPGQESSGFQRLEDDGDDILFIEKREQKVLHTGIGHAPADIRRYTNFPEGEVRLRSLPNLDTPRPGDDFGYIDGNESPYEAPTDAEELWIPPGTHLDFNFYNADTEPNKPLINVKLREYNIRALDPNNSAEHSAIRRVVSSGSPIPIVPAGSMDRQEDFDLEEYWKTTPIPFEQARNLGGGN